MGDRVKLSASKAPFLSQLLVFCLKEIKGGRKQNPSGDEKMFTGKESPQTKIEVNFFKVTNRTFCLSPLSLKFKQTLGLGFISISSFSCSACLIPSSFSRIAAMKVCELSSLNLGSFSILIFLRHLGVGKQIGKLFLCPF